MTLLQGSSLDFNFSYSVLTQETSVFSIQIVTSISGNKSRRPIWVLRGLEIYILVSDLTVRVRAHCFSVAAGIMVRQHPYLAVLLLLPGTSVTVYRTALSPSWCCLPVSIRKEAPCVSGLVFYPRAWCVAEHRVDPQ